MRSGDERRRNTQSGVAVGAVEVQLLSSSHVDDDRYRAARQRSGTVRDPAVPVSDDFGVVGQRFVGLAQFLLGPAAAVMPLGPGRFELHGFGVVSDRFLPIALLLVSSAALVIDVGSRQLCLDGAGVVGDRLVELVPLLQ